jgi:hypothetical protein
VVGDNQIGGLANDPLEALKMHTFLGSLNDESKFNLDALAKGSGIMTSVTRDACIFPHLAGQAGITAIKRRLIRDIGNAIKVIVQIT